VVISRSCGFPTTAATESTAAMVKHTVAMPVMIAGPEKKKPIEMAK